MKLTKKQEKGLDIAIERFKNNEKYTVISGYAGSGKSTLVKFIVSALGNLGINPNKEVCYACFTGKATQVLLKKGNKNVQTLHKLLYQSFPRADGTFYRKPVPNLDPYKIIVVDEISMVPAELIKLLFSHNVYIICLGDPFQLPPINKKEDNHLLDKPHIFLDEIIRQAQESEIIRLSMKIRGQQKIEYNENTNSDAIVLPENKLNTGMLTWADQILCATNQKRVDLNNEMRRLLNREFNPVDGDKVICLRNYWNYFADNQDPLVNGTIGYLKNSYLTNFKLPYTFKNLSYEVLVSDFESDSGSYFSDLNMDKNNILTGKKTLDWKTEYRMMQNNRLSLLVPLEFTYGYAITTHKAQGSEWDKVLVIEEGFPFQKEDHARWLYTACTRATDKLVLIR